MTEVIYVKQRLKLLQNLYSTIESLLINDLTNIWSTDGALNHLHSILEKIFKHGCRLYESKDEISFWAFIQGLNWLQPSSSSSPTTEGDYFNKRRENNENNLPSRIKSQKDLFWLYERIEDFSLSQKLSWLLSDKEHLLSCYEPWAYLCQDNLSEATLICLKAVERKDSSLLTDIDPSLFLSNWSSDDNTKKAHRRSSSFPVSLPSTSVCGKTITSEDSLKSSVNSLMKIKNETLFTKRIEVLNKNKLNCINVAKDWNSLVEIRDEAENNLLHQTSSSNNESSNCTLTQSVELLDYTKGKSLSTEIIKSDIKSKYLNETQKQNQKSSDHSSIRLKNSLSSLKQKTQPVNTLANSKEIKPENKSSFITGSAPEFSGSWTAEIENKKEVPIIKKSFIEDGGSVLPMSIGYFPRPKKGQTLTSFLTSTLFSRESAELDRENAHFSISEAMISAIEQLKCNKQFHIFDEAVEESDEEINNLKQRIRLRRRQRLEERQKGATWCQNLLSDGVTDTTTTDQSVSPLSSSPGTPSESIMTDDVEDLEVDDTQSLHELKNSGLSMSMASLYSEADLYKTPQKNTTDLILNDSIISAEGVALSLLSKFSEKHLPKASDLKWLVSEQDVPQRLLPLPKSWPVCPYDAEIDEKSSVTLRGTTEWAPPRPQIILTAHPHPVRRILIAKQNYRCAGCGMKVAVKYSNRFRYCEYLGKYFCTGCHTNQVSLIPGKILSKWDFNRYPVSNFSYRLLDKMMTDPLFMVNDLNPLLYRRIKQLNRTKQLRVQLHFLKDFLFNCRFSTQTQEALKKEASHIISEIDIYSLQDFTQVKTGILPAELSKLVQECCKHVAECILCQARGFICELCKSSDIIYPWELGKVFKCENCGNCYHIICVNNLSKFDCKRCYRLEIKKASNQL